jgi:uncharacterized protein (DUF1499 family)
VPPDPIPGLTPCPRRLNCVSTRSEDPRRALRPIPFEGTVEEAQRRLRGIVTGMPRSEIVAERPGFLAVEFRSRLFGFVDDAEFVLDGAKGEIHFRSGARTGAYDFGVNRSRMKRMARAFRRAPC